MNNDAAKAEQDAEQAAAQEMEQRKLKLIKAVYDKDPKVLLAVDNVSVAESEKQKVYEMIFDGAVTWSNFSILIKSIPAAAVDAAFAAVASSKYKARILAYMCGVGFDNFAQITPENVSEFLRRYPEPDAFDSPANDFLEAIKRSNPEQKYLDYKREMEEFRRAVYGEKEAYVLAARELIEDVSEWKLDQEAKKLENEMIGISVIDGDLWEQNGQSFSLTAEMLKEVGLGPRYLLEMGGIEIALSRVFKVDTHEAAIGYIKFDDKVRVRGYYRSNSQGMWRHLADYVGGNGEIAWYGTGFNEESLTLPLKIQKQLNAISGKGIFEITSVNTGFFLGGTAKRFKSKEDYKQMLAYDKMEADYYKEVNRQPLLDFGVLSPQKFPPEGIDLTGDNEPNFRNMLDKYTMKTDMYGEVTVRQFPSNDDNLRFTMCEVGKNSDKKVWVAGIEVNSPITSTGLKKEWVSTGDICTPLYEYKSMTSGYGDAEGRTDGYESMWEKYLSQMPLIKKYLYTWRDSV